MSAFEFVFSFFGLLLGFSLVEVLGGLARALAARVRPAPGDVGQIRIGWLTPLLGLYVMLDLVSFWGASWSARENLTVSGPIMLGGLFFAGAYYLAAHLVFPPDPRTEPDLDAHYFRVRHLVLGAVTALMALQLCYWLAVPDLAVNFSNPLLIAKVVICFVLLGTAMLARGRTMSTIALVLLVAQYVYDYLGQT